jgi:hypothetical protein
MKKPHLFSRNVKASLEFGKVHNRKIHYIGKNPHILWFSLGGNFLSHAHNGDEGKRNSSFKNFEQWNTYKVLLENHSLVKASPIVCAKENCH